MKIEIEYTLPTADMFRGLAHINTQGGMRARRNGIAEEREKVGYLITATSQLWKLKALSEKAIEEKRKIIFSSQYSRGPKGKAFDDDNALMIINKIVIDSLVKAGYLPGDQPKWLRQEIPEYIGNEAQPRLILQFKLGG